MKYSAFILVAIAMAACARDASAIDRSVPAVRGDVSRVLLGDGTGVIVGVVDSGVDDTHPALAGTDSLGQPRLVAEANFVTSESANTGDDVFGHGTWVADAALGRDATFQGLAPDARFVNARVLDRFNSFQSSTQVKNGVGFAVENGADVLNLSLNFFAPVNDGGNSLDRMLDWAAAERGVSIAVSSGNIQNAQNDYPRVRGPGSAFNVVTVGRTDTTFTRVHPDSAHAFTGDGRMKPDLVAPGSGLTLANDDWEGSAPDYDFNLNGTSFAAPHVAGMIAQQIDAGRRLGMDTNPLIIKATMMNSATKVLGKAGQPWSPAGATQSGGLFTASQPLDIDSGAGQIDGEMLAAQYLAGEQPAGAVDLIGWDANEIGQSEFVEYRINEYIAAGSPIAATLTWFRHVERVDDGDNIINAADQFFLNEGVDDLNLQILRDGQLIAQSVSRIDNVEHLSLIAETGGRYSVRVVGTNITGADPMESFAVAWHAVPEPGTLVWVVCAFGLVVGRGHPRRAV